MRVSARHIYAHSGCINRNREEKRDERALFFHIVEIERRPIQCSAAAAAESEVYIIVKHAWHPGKKHGEIETLKSARGRNEEDIVRLDIDEEWRPKIVQR